MRRLRVGALALAVMTIVAIQASADEMKALDRAELAVGRRGIPIWACRLNETHLNDRGPCCYSAVFQVEKARFWKRERSALTRPAIEPAIVVLFSVVI